MAQPTDRILEVVASALEDLEGSRAPLSGVIRKAIRIARLRNDHANLWWLAWEMIPFGDKVLRKQAIAEVAGHYSAEQFKYLYEHFRDVYMAERQVRTFDDDGVPIKGDMFLPAPVEELEQRVDQLVAGQADTSPPAGLHPMDALEVHRARSWTASMYGAMETDTRAVLVRIKQRAHDFLSRTEKQLLYGQINADVFEENRRFVDERLKRLAPDVLEKFVAAYARAHDGDPEGRSHALTSCRRILKAVADVVYPANPEPVTGPDGKKRVLNDEKYVSRLWQFVFDRVGKRTAGELMMASITDLGHRIDALNSLASKGVHAEVSSFEVNQCVIQTYLIVGDVLRLLDGNSAVEQEVEPVGEPVGSGG